jgi:hypothetical protein
MDLFKVLLFLHLFGAIVGIGPTFAFGRIIILGSTSAGHGPFATRVVHALTRRMAIPLAAIVLFSGFGMILEVPYDVFAAGWLLVSIILFLGGFGYSIVVQNPTLARIITLNGELAKAGGEPSAELLRLRRRAAHGGIYLRTSATLILILMVFKPF